MGLKDSFTGSSVLTKVVLILLVLAQICSWISFCTPEWGRTWSNPRRNDAYGALGLWRSCSYSGPNQAPSACSPLEGNALDWFIAVQAMAILGFIGINIAFLVVVLQIFTSCLKSINDIGFVNAIQCIVTAVLFLIGVIIFAVEFDGGYYQRAVTVPSGYTLPKIGELGYSFGLAIVAIVLAIVSGVLMIVDQMKGAGTSPA